MSDKLDRALRTLREEETGTNPRSDETLGRILASRRAARSVWPKRARVWLPLAAALAIGTTALARSGVIQTVKELVTHHHEAPVSAPPVLHQGPPPPPPSRDAHVENAPPPPPAPPLPEQAPEVRALVAPAPAVSSPLRHAAPHSSAPLAPPVAAAPDTVAPPAGSTLADTAEADVYTRAHRLHFDGADPIAAIGAWDDYLARYPQGRFAPDARFNRAIDLLKTKRYAEARAALQPFADGAYGGYHQSAAQDLLRSIPELRSGQ